MLNPTIDYRFLRHSFALAEDAKSRGIHPLRPYWSMPTARYYWSKSTAICLIWI